MDKGANKGHLSDIVIELYCDNELNKEEMLRVKEHLTGCERCKKVYDDTQNFSKLLYNVLDKRFLVENLGGCLSDMEISAYIDKQLTADEREKIEEHLSKCRHCLTVLTATEKALKMHIKEESLLSHEKIMHIVEKQLGAIKKGEVLFEKYTEIAKKSPFNVQKSLEGIKNNIKAMLKNTFAYPSPRFAPVFGEHPVTVFSPFGKVRYPIIFKWMSYEGADRYTISIEDTAWSLTTKKTKIEANAEALKLEHGKEYMWELNAMRSEEVIEGLTGFFTLASDEEIKELKEIEKQLKTIEPEQDRLMLWGGILEEKEFYMEAVEEYKKAYQMEPVGGIAYRIAYCYDKVELEELRDEWNKKIENV